MAGSNRRLEDPVKVVLGQIRAAMRTGESLLDALRFLVERFVEKDHLTRAIRTGEDLTPDGVLDLAKLQPRRTRRFTKKNLEYLAFVPLGILAAE